MRFLRLISLFIFAFSHLSLVSIGYSFRSQLSDNQTITENSKQLLQLTGNNADLKFNNSYNDVRISERPINSLPGARLQATAQNDESTSNEDEDAVIDVLNNDNASDGAIDPSSIDLDQETEGIQSSITVRQGLFLVNAGKINYNPSENYTGTFAISYTVNDDLGGTSNVALVNITVDPVNDKPIIDDQMPSSTSTVEDTDFTIELSNLVITDPDINSVFTLIVLPGINYTVINNVVTPSKNFSGPLTVNVKVNDGSMDSDSFGVTASVSAVNDAPSITDQTPAAISATENQSFTISLDNLVASDPENSALTLIVLAGTNYSFTGNTITPASNYNGSLTVNVKVSDGALDSAPFGVEVNVASVNSTPIITGQTPTSLTATEDQTFNVALSNLLISDPDNSTFTLTVLPGSNYTFSGTTITPTLNHSGSLTVNVKVNDGNTDSTPYGIEVNVQAVNDAPVITGQTPSPLVTNEEQSITPTLSNLLVTDVDNTYPSGYSMTIFNGTNYTVSGSTIIPNSNFAGMLSVGVSVNDGSASSNTYNLQIKVDPTNDPPSITGQSLLSVNEDNSITIELSSLSVVDSDNSYPSGFTLIASSGTNFTASGNTITPAFNFNGTLLVPVTVNDGASNSNTFNVTITVNAINDVPIVTGQKPLSVGESEPITITLSQLFVLDPDNAFPEDFSLLVTSGQNYVLSGDQVAPNANFSGVLFVKVFVNDGTALSAPYNLQILVNSVNDAPVITSQQELSVDEDASITIQLLNLTVSDPDNNYPTGFTLNVLPGTNYTYSGNTVTPVPNFTGALTVSVKVNDGLSDSAPFNLHITVNPGNDAPVITGQQPLDTNEDVALTLQPTNFVVSDPDNTYPVGFTLTVLEGTNYTVSGNTVTPAENFSGMLTVPVRVNDGINNSNTFNTQVQVKSVNDLPIITGQVPLATNENSPIIIQLSNLTVTDVDNTYPSGFSLTILSGANYTFSGTTITPSANFNGILTVPVMVNDGTSSSTSFNLQIQVAEINNPPTLNDIANITMSEDDPQKLISLTGITAGSGENQFLSVSVLSTNTSLFEVLEVIYTSPQSIATLKVTPKPNQFGSAQITVKVIDDNTGGLPSPNSVSKKFTITIQSVNDIPQFKFVPTTIAIVGELFSDSVKIEDVDNTTLTLTLVATPNVNTWLKLTSTDGKKAKLSGTPPPNGGGVSRIKLQAKDASATVTFPEYDLIIDRRPVVNPIAIASNEDVIFNFQSQDFLSSFVDVDGDDIKRIKVNTLPRHGTLMFGSTVVSRDAEIPFSSITELTYQPNVEYNGRDTIYYHASDDYVYSDNVSYINFFITPVNDSPVITLETIPLVYEIGSGQVQLTKEFTFADADDDSIMRAEIGFRRENYQASVDVLTFTNTLNIVGTFDNVAGILTLSGKAPVSEYIDAIRSILYSNTSTTISSSSLDKSVYITLSDGLSLSETKDRGVSLILTFKEFIIFDGFTPNASDDVNSTWVVLDSQQFDFDYLKESKIRVYNKNGVKVYEVTGFDKPWDGKYKDQLVPPGTYFYTIEALDSRFRSLKKSYKGILNVVY